VVFFSFSKISVCKREPWFSSSCVRSYWMETDTHCFLQLHHCCHAVTVLMGFKKTNWNLLPIFPNPLQCFKGIMQVTCHYFLTGSWWSGFRGGFWRQWDGGENNKIQVTRKQVDMTQVEWKAKGHKIHEENTHYQSCVSFQKFSLILIHYIGRAVAQRLDAGFPPWWPGFTYGQHVGFVVDKAALGQVLRFPLPIIPPISPLS
jgi:hypothetical protein